MDLRHREDNQAQANPGQAIDAGAAKPGGAGGGGRKSASAVPRPPADRKERTGNRSAANRHTGRNPAGRRPAAAAESRPAAAMQSAAGCCGKPPRVGPGPGAKTATIPTPPSSNSSGGVVMPNQTKFVMRRRFVGKNPFALEQRPQPSGMIDRQLQARRQVVHRISPGVGRGGVQGQPGGQGEQPGRPQYAPAAAANSRHSTNPVPAFPGWRQKALLP